MAIGKRIRFFRTLKNLTQKELGLKLRYPERAADVRVAQYESETRVPKEDTIERLSYIFDVSIFLTSFDPEVIVKFIFVPVSPSGTGKTFNSLMISFLASIYTMVSL